MLRLAGVGADGFRPEAVDIALLDQLPPKGAVIIAAPLKIKQGSGSPLRVLALVAGERA